MTTSYQESFISPIGTMRVCANDKAIETIHFIEPASDIAPYRNDPADVCVRIESDNVNALTSNAIDQLIEYFNKKRTTFDLPLGASGTEFQQRVWNALNDIPYGQTCSYGDIAKQIDNPKGMRAVGLANGKNPLTIVVPCHRVIGANGKLTGYASGTERKSWLLNHEQGSLF